MRLSSSFPVIMYIGANECVLTKYQKIEPEHLFCALLKFSELSGESIREISRDKEAITHLETDRRNLLSYLAANKIDSTELRRKIRSLVGEGGGPPSGRVVHRSEATKKLFGLGFQLAIDEKKSVLEPLHLFKTLIRHSSKILAGISELAEIIQGSDAPPHEHHSETADPAIHNDTSGPTSLGVLTAHLRELRKKLSATVIGQEHGVNTFIDGLFSAEVFSGAETDRRAPKGLFVFAGPPGVGKTYLAETAASELARPFKRFDMSGYASHEEAFSLAGAHKSYKDAHPGILTGFVEENPNAILLFDEIEKAHLNTVQLFLQILDAGRLEDKYTEKTVEFGSVLIIFTTNAGKALYEDPNRTGVQATNSTWHRKTILDALATEVDQRTGRPFFPQAICSRMATGYPVMFNKLGVAELERIGFMALDRMTAIVEQSIGKRLTLGPLISMCLLLREGVDTDARTLTSQNRLFIKEEIFKFARLFKQERLDQIIQDKGSLHIDIDAADKLPDEIREVLIGNDNPAILIIADDYIIETWQPHFKDLNVIWANNLDQINTLLATRPIDAILLDLWVGQSSQLQQTEIGNQTVYQFDFIPGGAHDIAEGQEILRSIHEKHPAIPCMLLSYRKRVKGRPTVDDELFLACTKSGGARGIIETSFLSSDIEGWKEDCRALRSEIIETAQKLRRECKVMQLGKERKSLSFTTVPELSNGTIRIRLRDLRFQQTLMATDVNSVLQDYERPNLGFADVYGASAAKMELGYIVNWLKNPLEFRAKGLRSPKGILLYGYPGTGKTMLARALAGESNVAFLQTAATSFVTKWQGSGPENVRNLFDRARRYAPAIIFIDEIDAIGRKRDGVSGGGNSASEQTLNSLLVEMDGFQNRDDSPIIIIAATNLLESLDGALRRRFDREIEVDRPDRSARLAYLEKRLTGRNQETVSRKTLERIAGQSANMTIAELEKVIELAGRIAATSDSTISDSLLEEAFERIRMGDANPTNDSETLKRVARHEAGHCLAGWLIGERPVQVTIVGRGSAGGYVERRSEESRILYTKLELENLIYQTMAGRAAEIVCYGDELGLSSGASNDIKMATHYAEKMATEFGMTKEIGPVCLESSQLQNSMQIREVSIAVKSIVEEQLHRGIEQLQKHHAHLNVLVSALLEKNRLTTQELKELLGNIGANPQ